MGSQPTAGDVFKFTTTLVIDQSTHVLFFCKLPKFLVMSSDNTRKILSLAQHMEVSKHLDSGQSCRMVAKEVECGKTQISQIHLDRTVISSEWPA